MEIERFLRERCKNYYDDYSFVNLELNNAGSEEVLCFYCKKPVLGTCIKEDDNDYYHRSCKVVSPKMESLFLHDKSGHGDLIFTGELKSKGKEDAVCFGCEKPVTGPGYECSAPECKFLLHQSCAELPLKMQYPYHSHHTLYLLEPTTILYCEACDEYRGGCFYYHCNECGFELDFSCVTWLVKNKDDCHHEYRPIFMKSWFSCDACGEQVKGISCPMQHLSTLDSQKMW